MSVIPFRPKKAEVEQPPEEFGDSLILPGPTLPEACEETVALAQKQQRLHRLIGLTPALILAGVLVYWAMALFAHKIDDDLDFPQNIRQTWSSPWAGVSASILEREYSRNGWAPSAADWTPAARLTAKPAWQTALAEAFGANAGLAAQQAEAVEGEPDADLATAARLLIGSVNPSELRAAREALLSYDGRVRRHRVSGDVTAEQFAERLMLMASWSQASSRELMDVFHTADGWPLDDHAVVSIYRARARAYAAHRLISAMDAHYRDDVRVYREAALNAWARAATFSPLIVMNGAPDSMVFTSHAAAMRALLLEAEEATIAYAEALSPSAQTEADPAQAIDGAVEAAFEGARRASDVMTP